MLLQFVLFAAGLLAQVAWPSAEIIKRTEAESLNIRAQSDGPQEVPAMRFLERRLDSSDSILSDVDSTVVKKECNLRCWIMRELIDLAGRLVYCIVNILLGCCFASVLEEFKERPHLPELPHGEHYDHDFESRILSCCEDPATCCLGLWFPFILWARTEHEAGELHFMSALGRLLLVFALGSVVSPLLFFVLAVLFRQRLRHKANLDEKVCHDVMAVLCCFSLALCQQARHVDKCYALEERDRLVGGLVTPNPTPRVGTLEIAATYR